MLLLLLHVILFVCQMVDDFCEYFCWFTYLFMKKKMSFIHVNISTIVLLKEMWLSCTENDQKLGWPSIYICTCLIILPDQELTFGCNLYPFFDCSCALSCLIWSISPLVCCQLKFLGILRGYFFHVIEGLENPEDLYLRYIVI